MGRVTAYLGLGTNLGDRESNIKAALDLLKGCGDIGAVSSIYETTPWGYLDQPDFLNCVCAINTELDPQSLLAATQAVELDLGRRPNFRFGPRLIDVDILLYGEVIHHTKDLEIPHLRMAQRAFVLVPLAEVAPDIKHPAVGKTISSLAEKVDGKEGVRLWAGPGALMG